LPLEISIALRVRLLVYNLPAELAKTNFKKLRQPAAIRRVEIEKYGGFLCLQIVSGEIRHHFALKRVDEAGAKNVVACLRDGRIG
jgi:hypothetical protein